MRPGGPEGEAVTPTGAALLAVLAEVGDPQVGPLDAAASADALRRDLDARALAPVYGLAECVLDLAFPPPWRGIAELVNEHQKLKLECECWRIMAAPGGGVGSFSQRLAVEKGDLAACREWAKKNDAFIEDLQKQAYSVREKVEAAVKAALEACAVECEKSESDNSWAYALRCRELDASAIVKRALGGEK